MFYRLRHVQASDGELGEVKAIPGHLHRREWVSDLEDSGRHDAALAAVREVQGTSAGGAPSSR